MHTDSNKTAIPGHTEGLSGHHGILHSSFQSRNSFPSEKMCPWSPLIGHIGLPMPPPHTPSQSSYFARMVPRPCEGSVMVPARRQHLPGPGRGCSEGCVRPGPASSCRAVSPAVRTQASRNGGVEKGAVPPTATHSDPVTEVLLPIPVTVSCWPSTLSARGRRASQEHHSIEWKLDRARPLCSPHACASKARKGVLVLAG